MSFFYMQGGRDEQHFKAYPSNEDCFLFLQISRLRLQNNGRTCGQMILTSVKNVHLPKVKGYCRQAEGDKNYTRVNERKKDKRFFFHRMY